MIPILPHPLRIYHRMPKNLPICPPRLTLRKPGIIRPIPWENTISVPIVRNSPFLVAARFGIIASSSARGVPEPVIVVAELLQVLFSIVVRVPFTHQLETGKWRCNRNDFNVPITPVVWFDWSTTSSPLEEDVWTAP